MAVRKRGPRKQNQKSSEKHGEDGAATLQKVAHSVEKKAFLTPSYNEVVAAVSSLYDDELKPFGRILRKRIGELANIDSCANVDNLPEVDINHVKNVCEGSSSMMVQSEEGGDWSAVLLDRQQSFIDIYSQCDNYSTELWQSISSYFENSKIDDTLLPGGRYCCAKTLTARALSFLQGYSLGQVCHIVQLAMTQRKILGYLNGSIVPYAKSQAKFKEECVMSSQRCLASQQENSTDSTELRKATWDSTRHCLQEILDSAPESAEGIHIVPLSNVKRIFRSKYNLMLCETLLGHCKLSELLQDERLSDICTCRLGKHGYRVEQVPKASRANSKSDKSTSIESNESESTTSIGSDAGSSIDHSTDFPMDDFLKGQSPERFARAHFEPFDFDDVDTFLALNVPTSSDFEPDEPQRRSQFCLNEPLEGIDELGCFPHTAVYGEAFRAHSPSANLQDRWIGSVALSKVHNTFIHSPLLPATPLRNSGSRRARSLPKNVGSDKNSWEDTCRALGCVYVERPDEKGIQHEFDVNDCTTPSVYGSYDGPTCLPPSPGLLASPSCFGTYSPFLRSAYQEWPIAPVSLLSDLGWSAPLSPSSKVLFLSGHV